MFVGSVARWADRRSFDFVRTLRVLTSLRMTIPKSDAVRPHFAQDDNFVGGTESQKPKAKSEKPLS